jgi:hypothetical protein
MYSQTETSIPFTIDIYPCKSATVTVPSYPSDLVLDKSATAGSFSVQQLNPTYKNLFVSSEPVHCPIVSFNLLDDSNQPMVTHPHIRMTFPTQTASTKLHVNLTSSFTVWVRVRGNTAHKQNYFRMKIRVCGEENVNLQSAAKKYYIYGIESASSSSRYLSFSQGTLASWFNLNTGSSDPCAINHFEILSSISPDTAWDTADGRAELLGSFGSHTLRIDKSIATNTVSVWIRAKTRGLKYNQ